MLSYFLTQLIRSLGVVGRTIRTFFIRQGTWLISVFRRFTNVSRGAAKMANSALRSTLTVSQKPSKREDYIETRRLLISKALIIKVVIAVVVVVLLVWLWVWPFVLSHFLTARFYVEDERVDTWSGKVIVYADRDKTIPLYEGRLEEGLLQGRGKEYDENGVLSYEGQFQDGLRSGTGSEYQDGVLVYQGQFAMDMREGTGTEYQDGLVCYEGQFQAGVYQGQGKRYEEGVLVYAGGFEDGLESGTGTAYDETGSVVYEGGFSAGLYSGQGTLYLAPGQTLEATFQEGAPEGAVKWSKDGLLYYEGEWSQAGPQGYGTLYGKNGSPLYQGQFAQGTVDGTWLLSLSAEELRQALGTEEESTSASGGFLISAPQLGLTALCSFQTEEEPAAVHTVWLVSAAEDWVELLPAEGVDFFEAAAPEGANLWEGESNFIPPQGVDFTAGTYAARTATTEDSQLAVLLDEEGAAALVRWSLTGQQPTSLENGAEGQESPGTVEEFLDALSQMGGAGGSQSAAPKGGSTSPEKLLSSCATAEQAKQMVDALMDWWAGSWQLWALESRQTRETTLLEEAKTAQATGTGSAEETQALEQQLQETDWAIQQQQLELGKAEAALGGVDPKQYQLSELAANFDPSGGDASQLAAITAAYAQGAGREVDTDSLEQELKTALAALEQAWLQVQSALERGEWCAQTAQSAAGAYAMGNGSKADWYQALYDQEAAQAQVCAALAEFTRQANDLNWTTGGWVSRTFDWQNDIFTPLYQAELTAGEGTEQGG